MSDKVSRILRAARRRDAFDHAIHALVEARKAIREARLKIGGPPSYAKNRMGCVAVEIGAAIRGLRVARKDASRAIDKIAKSGHQSGSS